MSRTHETIAIGCALLLRATTSLAGVSGVVCEDAQPFATAAVNVVVLPPLRADSAMGAELSETARRVSYLVYLNTLGSIAKYGSIGVILLVPGSSENACTMARVKSTLAHSGKRRGGVILLSSHLYQDGANIYLRHDLELLEPVRPILRAGATPLDATIGAGNVMFSPRLMTSEFLGQVEREYRQSLVLRREPRVDAPGRPFPVGDPRAFRVSVAETRGEWMRLESLENDASGWVHLGTLSAGARVKSILPEIGFIDALAGFFRFRSLPAQGAERMSYLRASEAALSDFEERGAELDLGAPVSLGLQLLGVMELESGDLRGAQHAFDRAASAFPDSASAANLKQVSLLVADSSLLARQKRTVLAGFVNALVLEPSNRDVQQNLQRLYDAASREPDTGAVGERVSREELRSQQRSLAAIQAR